jgi:two-component system, NtrC family, sensor histidine kinase KinB
MLQTLRAKIFGGYLVILALLAGLGVYSIISFRSISLTGSTALELNAENSINTLQMYESLVRMNEGMLKMMGAEFLQGKRALTEQPAIFKTALQNAHRSSANTATELNPALTEQLTRIELLWQQHEALIPEFIRIAESNPLDARRFYEQSITPSYQDIKDRVFTLSNENAKTLALAKQRTSKESSSSTAAVILVAITAVGIGIVVSYILARRTTEPLAKLRSRLSSLREGNLSLRLPVTSSDELGDVSYEFNRLTERLQAYEEMNVSQLVQEKQKSETILASINDPIYFFDETLSLRLVNQAGLALLDLRESDVLGRSLEVFRIESVRVGLEKLFSDIEQNQPIIVSAVVNGKERFYRIQSIQVVSSDTTIGTLISFSDITHFQELDELKSDFIARVSHEFRTPLTSMKMSLDLLQREVLGKVSSEQKDILETLKNDTDRLAKLIQDLLAITKLESKKSLDLSDISCDVTASFTSLCQSMKGIFESKGISLSIDTAKVPLLRILKSDFESVVQNLLGNASKFTPDGGIVKVSLTYDGIMLKVKVVDSGIGIADSDKARVFEKFVQVKPTNLATPGSLGLGLTIVSEIARKYNGKVELESEVGKGSTFTVYLQAEKA